MSSRSEFDRGANTFSPDGRLSQVEHAIEASKLGSTAIGVQTSEGVVLVAEKRITSPLMEPRTMKQIFEIDKHIGCAVSGLMVDARTMVDQARVKAQDHWFTFDEKISIESVTQLVSNLAIQFGYSGGVGNTMSRPFGVAILFAGVDEKGPQLFHVNPSGEYVQYDAKAIGSRGDRAQQLLITSYINTMTLREAMKLALTVLKEVMEEELSSTNVEVAAVTPNLSFHMYSQEQVENVIQEIA